MCWQCNHPGATRRDYLDHIRGLITSFGWAVQYVEPSGRTPPLAYTVGLTPRGYPEFVLTGTRAEESTRLLNELAAHALHAPAIRAGDLVTLPDGRCVEIVELPHPDAHLDVATDLYGDQVRGLQVVRPDDRGRYPWERGYRDGRWPQPVLGPRAGVAR